MRLSLCATLSTRPDGKRFFRGNLQWAEVFAGYRSTVDVPGTAFWRALVDVYPEAKIILLRSSGEGVS